MKNLPPILFLVILFPLAGHIQAEIALKDTSLFYIDDYLMDDQHSYVGFKIKYFGFSPVRGRFNNFQGHLLYDSTDQSKTAATVYIDVGSINTGVDMRDNDLKSEHWFDVARHPHIYFKSTSCQVNAFGFVLKGLLRIKGQEKEVSINFEEPTTISRDFAGNQQVDFSGRLKIKRSDFDILGSGFWNSLMDGTLKQLADEVEIEIDIHARRPDYMIRHEDLENSNIRKILIDSLMSASDEQRADILSPYRVQENRDKSGLTSGALNTIGHIFLAMEKLSLARQIFEARSNWFPDASQTEVNLARVHARLEDKKQVEHLLHLAISKDSINTNALELLRQIE